jgi:hypothetical protein
MKRRVITRCCPRCKGVGQLLPQLIGGKWHGGDDPHFLCYRCRGEGVLTYVILGKKTTVAD